MKKKWEEIDTFCVRENKNFQKFSSQRQTLQVISKPVLFLQLPLKGPQRYESIYKLWLPVYVNLGDNTWSSTIIQQTAVLWLETFHSKANVWNQTPCKISWLLLAFYNLQWPVETVCIYTAIHFLGICIHFWISVFYVHQFSCPTVSTHYCYYSL